MLALTDMHVPADADAGARVQRALLASSQSAGNLRRLDASSSSSVAAAGQYHAKARTPRSSSAAGAGAGHYRSRSSGAKGAGWGTGGGAADEHSWLLATATMLARQTAESKGQLWLAARSASTSLVGTPHVEREGFHFEAIRQPHGRREAEGLSLASSRAQTRRESLAPSVASADENGGGSRYSYSYTHAGGAGLGGTRKGSKRGSRVNLMTSSGIRTPGEEEEEEEEEGEVGPGGRSAVDYFESLGVDFADEEDDWEGELLGDEDDEDLDAEESELKRLVWGRVGGWVDWAVGWMDWRDGLEGVALGEEEDGDAGAEGGHGEGGSRADSGERHDAGKSAKAGKEVEREKRREEREKRRRRREELRHAETTVLGEGRGDSVPAPEGEGAGVLRDARWLLGVVGRTLA
ncbi:MAG: hypothetical protein LQ340_008053 [Diploschistes diacapsis]|nr:MAG: hypothetical protein LQ340_008053 [Diploschistes diacapsis]